jgi:hypothetical protein
MPAKLLSLYVRLGTGAVRLAFRLTERAVMLAGSAIGLPGRDAAEARAEPRVERPAAEHRGPAMRAPAADEAAIDYEAEPATPLEPARDQAKTIDEEPELVEELAEPGAEDGAGAEVEVQEPWEGYADMNADAVIGRVRNASAAELTLVELYERVNKHRKTVLAAAERRHKAISGPAGSSR